MSLSGKIHYVNTCVKSLWEKQLVLSWLSALCFVKFLTVDLTFTQKLFLKDDLFLKYFFIS